MEATINISYLPVGKAFYVSSYELEDYHLDAEADELPAAVEQFFSWIAFEQEAFERFGQRDEIPDARKLYNMQLEVVAADGLPDAERPYVEALRIMLRRHHGQKDKAGRDYYFHPMRVAHRCVDPKAKIVALLHDTIEDTGLTPGELRQEGFGEDIISGVLAVTRREGETYAQFIGRAKRDAYGASVKISDLEDNMDVTRLPDLKEKDWHRLNKYLHAWRYLCNLEKDTSLIGD